MGHLKIRRKLGVVVVAAITAVTFASASAVAQNPAPKAAPTVAPDGSSGSGSVGAAAFVNTNCGGDISTNVKTENSSASFTGSTFTNLTSTTVNVPSGTTRCVIITFSAETACSGDAGTFNDFCYFRVLDNGTGVNPADDFIAYDSERDTAAMHSHQWVKRVGPGAHTFTVQRRTDGGSTSFFVDDWTYTVTTAF